MSGSSGSQPGQVPNGISPVLLKQFNVYEPLTPQKVVSSHTSSLNEDLLIDFESPIEVNRTAEKEDFDVIDLYQNIYVTPQLINNKPKTKTETNVDYEDFLRKLESRNKYCTQNSETTPVPPRNGLLDFDFTYFNEISKTENRPLTNNNDSNKNSLCLESMSSFNHEPDSYQEELIEEVLLDRTLEKLRVLDAESEQISKKLRVLSTPKISNININQLHNEINLVPKQTFPITQDSKIETCWKRDNIPTLNQYHDHDKKDRSVYSNENITKQANLNVLGSNDTFYHNNHLATTSKISTISIDQYQNHYNIIKPCSSTDRHCNEDTMPARKTTHLNVISNQREDTLNNERILTLKTPQQNHHVTHDFMQLYAKRDLYSNALTIPTRNDNNKSDHSVSCSQNVTNHDNLNNTPKNTNSDHLKELKSVVSNQHLDSQSKSFITDITTLLHLTVDPGEMKKVSVQAVIKDNKEYAKSHRTKSNTEKLTYTKGPDLNEKNIVLPQLLSRLSAQKNKRDAKNNVRKRWLLYSDSIEVNTGQNQASVELKPTILMEDCNRERLIALQTRQRLSNLVQGGNIF